MVHFIDRKLLFKRLILEFANNDDINNAKKEKCDLILSFNMFANVEKSGEVPTWILFYKNVNSIEDLYSKQGKNIRNSCSFCKREGYNYHYLNSGEITATHLKAFQKMCNKMYKIRKLRTRVNLKFLKEYIKNGNLGLSFVEKNKEIYCFHVYVLDGKHTRTWYSCSLIHTNMDDRLLSKIKRYNRYCDIEHFYNQKYICYDFGGINSSTNPDGRARYKMEFYGESYIVYQKQFNISKISSMYDTLMIIIHSIIRR